MGKEVGRGSSQPCKPAMPSVPGLSWACGQSVARCGEAASPIQTTCRMWYRISEWFGELGERYRVLRDFNKSAKDAFVAGFAPTLLEVKVTRGDGQFRHAFSRFMGGGFRIKALTGRPLDRSELVEIAMVVLENDLLVRKMVSLGWDTLEVHDSAGSQGIKYPLKDYAKIGGILS